MCVCIIYVCPDTIHIYYNIGVSSYVSILEFKTIAPVQVASVLEVADIDIHKTATSVSIDIKGKRTFVYYALCL